MEENNKSKINALEDEKVSLKNNLVEKDNIIEKLKKDLESSSSSNDLILKDRKINELIDEINRIKSIKDNEIKDRDNRIDSLKQEIESLKKNQNNDNLNFENIKLKEEIKRLKEEIADLKKDLENNKKDNKDDSTQTDESTERDKEYNDDEILLENFNDKSRVLNESIIYYIQNSFEKQFGEIPEKNVNVFRDCINTVWSESANSKYEYNSMKDLISEIDGYYYSYRLINN